MVGDYILVVYLSLLDSYIWLVITLGILLVSSRQLYMIGDYILVVYLLYMVGDYILVFYLSLLDSYIWLVITSW